MDPEFSLNRTHEVHDKLFCNESSPNVSMQTLITSYMLCVFVGSLSVLIMCGNCLVIISIMYFKQLHTPTNYLILSLAVSDLLVGVLVLPFSIILSVSSCWHLTGFLCKIRDLFDAFLCTASILNLCFISIERYHVVCQPLTYRTKITARVTAFMILVSWAMPAFITITSTVLNLKQSVSITRCSIFQSSKLAIIGAVFLSFIPAVIIFSVYLKILTVAQRQARSIQSTIKPGAAVSKKENKATKTLAIVVGIYLMCWSPYFLSTSFYPLSSDMPVPIIEAFKWLGWSNSMINPFVYGFFYKWFRSAFRLIFSGKIFQGDFSNSRLS
ncbi:trace amine-associated receptor 4-like [Salarias fasciatus]|uniref:trace amine-associated receptor 4-like n=1 Tax=Salarias fasciatus TaxID=181472 RepID=UPI0011765417|nr:trace amine-associated receptor 4-like [Salarias fasciatus]